MSKTSHWMIGWTAREAKEGMRQSREIPPLSFEGLKSLSAWKVSGQPKGFLLLEASNVPSLERIIVFLSDLLGIELSDLLMVECWPLAVMEGADQTGIDEYILRVERP